MCVVRHALERHAATKGGEVYAVFEGGERWTYADTLARVQTTAAALQAPAIQDRSGDLAIDFPRNGRVERRDIQRDDRSMRLSGQALDETVSDLASRAGDEHHGFAHARIILDR